MSKIYELGKVIKQSLTFQERLNHDNLNEKLAEILFVWPLIGVFVLQQFSRYQ